VGRPEGGVIGVGGFYREHPECVVVDEGGPYERFHENAVAIEDVTMSEFVVDAPKTVAEPIVDAVEGNDPDRLRTSPYVGRDGN